MNNTNDFGKWVSPIQLSTMPVDEIMAENKRLKAELVSFQMERDLRRMVEVNETKLHAKVYQLKSLLKDAAELIKEVYPVESLSPDKQIAFKKKFNQLEQYSI